MVHQLVDIVSKNGNLLLNIGPRSDGTIPEEVQQVLRDVGAWLAVNGEAIYGTRPWKIYGEGPTKVAAGSFHDTDTATYTAEDFRFTTKGNELYAIELGWPAGGEAIVQSLGKRSADRKLSQYCCLDPMASSSSTRSPMACTFTSGPAPGNMRMLFVFGLKVWRRSFRRLRGTLTHAQACCSRLPSLTQTLAAGGSCLFAPITASLQ